MSCISCSGRGPLRADGAHYSGEGAIREELGPLNSACWKHWVFTGQQSILMTAGSRAQKVLMSSQLMSSPPLQVSAGSRRGSSTPGNAQVSTPRLLGGAKTVPAYLKLGCLQALKTTRALAPSPPWLPPLHAHPGEEGMTFY